jgi:hypothetical protein
MISKYMFLIQSVAGNLNFKRGRDNGAPLNTLTLNNYLLVAMRRSIYSRAK